MIHKITLSGYSATTDDISGVLILGTCDSYGIERIQLELGPEWNALVIKATFNPPTGSEPVTVVADTSGQLRVPQEATSSAGQGAITFVGTAAGLQRISTDLPYIVKTHSQIEGATPSPTPSEWEQFVAQVQQARDDAEAAAQAAEDSQTAAAGSASAAAESAKQAAQATADISEAKDDALEAIQQAQNTAVQAVQTAQTDGVKAVNDAGNAKVEEIEQINALVPTPTPEDAGKVVVVKPDGTGYELGDAGSEINDTVVAPDTTWSSLNIVNKLCPPFSVTGDTVQFTPVEGYPLSVKSTIVATQSGDGDPSPTNVRPITPVEQVGAWVGGKNFLDIDQCTVVDGVNDFGFKVEGAPGGFRVHGVSAVTHVNASFAVLYSLQRYLFGKGYTFSWFSSYPIKSVYGLRTQSEKAIAVQLDLVEGQSYDFTVQIALSTEKLTAYEPYRGQLYTAPLDEPCYGGEIDLTGGTGEANRAAVVVTGDEGLRQSQNGGRVYFHIIFPDLLPPKSGGSVVVAQREQLCNLGTIGNPYSDDVDNCAWVYNTETSPATLRFRFSTLFNDAASAKTQLKSWYEAGTPLTVAYDVSAPTPFTVTPLSIPAPASPATAYSTAGEITVSGRSDPTVLIQQMQSRLAALESAQTGI